MSKKILFENVAPNSIVLVDYVDEKLTFDVQSVFELASQPLVDDNGFIVLDSVKP